MSKEYIIGLIVFFFIRTFWNMIQESRESWNPFKYIWDIPSLDSTFFSQKNKSPEKAEQLEQLYDEAIDRIQSGNRKADEYLPKILEQAEHVLSRKRTLETLRKATQEFVDELARLAGYDESDTDEDDFNCPGWNQIWSIYYRNKNRILKKNSYTENSSSTKNHQNSRKSFVEQKKRLFDEAIWAFKSARNRDELNEYYKTYTKRFQEFSSKTNWSFHNSVEDLALTALFDAIWGTLSGSGYSYSNEKTKKEDESKKKSYSSYQNHKNSKKSTEDKNRRIFEGIWCIQELKKKYYKLAKLNHPDHGGSHKAMQLLNRYYAEALGRIQAQAS